MADERERWVAGWGTDGIQRQVLRDDGWYDEDVPYDEAPRGRLERQREWGGGVLLALVLVAVLVGVARWLGDGLLA